MSKIDLTTDFKRKLINNSEKYYQSSKENEVVLEKTRQELFSEEVHQVGDGNGRDVFILPEHTYNDGRYDEYVIKLAKKGKQTLSDEWGGVEQNKTEIKRWTNLPVEKKDYFCPILLGDTNNFYWLVMPKGTVGNDVDLSMLRELDEWKKEAKENLSSIIEPRDINSSNVIYLDGEFFLADYGV